ncbi:MAG: hypothetical protein HY720_02270 [Planctomycetes bacterium]|nr:hypothetical protein [Planctomycetota bacterium]
MTTTHDPTPRGMTPPRPEVEVLLDDVAATIEAGLADVALAIRELAATIRDPTHRVTRPNPTRPRNPGGPPRAP